MPDPPVGEAPDAPRQAPPAPAPAAIGVVDYSTPRPHNRNAARALIFGLLGFIPFVPGVIAIVYARRGLRDAAADPTLGGQGTARAGLWLGVASIVAWVALSVAAVPATIEARRAAVRTHCMAMLRQLGVVTQIYANTNAGLLPATLDDLVKAKLLPAAAFQCPACAGDLTKPPASAGAFGNYGYVYIGNGQKVQAIRPISTTPLAYEPLTNHDGHGINVLYADAHVEFLPAAGAQAFLQRFGVATTQPATTQPATTQSPTTQPPPEVEP